METLDITKASAFSATSKVPPPIAGFKTFNNQVAGHLEFKNKPCFLIDNNDHVLKMVDTTKLTGITEMAFFERIFNKKKNDEKDLEYLKRFLPTYYGLLELDFNGESLHYLQLENLLSGYVRPSIMDIKIGKRTSDPFADETKVRKEAMKYEFQTQLGFRILGYKSFRFLTGKTEFHDKSFCKKLTPEEIVPNVSYFLDLKHVPARLHVVDKIIKKLHDLLHWFSHQTAIKFYSSSILIAFDGQKTNYESHKLHNQTFRCHLKDDVIVRMIDFPHTYFGINDKSIDLNYVYGLRNLINIFENLRDQINE